MTILIVGDANADLSAALSRFPSEGDDAPIGVLGWGSGGSATNVASALALLGASSRLLARIGRDPAAEVALKIARGASVDLDAVQTDDALPTGLCFAAISPGGERTFFSYRGANVALMLPAPLELDDVRWVHIAGHALLEGSQRATALAVIDMAAARNIPISLDICLPTVRAWRDETLNLLPNLHVLFANEVELATLLGTSDGQRVGEVSLDERAAQAASLLAGDTTTIVALKLGARGSLVVRGEESHHIPALPITPLDTNGCGDAYVAGFVYAYLSGLSPERSAALANALGALAATRPGAAEALPDRDALRVFLDLQGRSDLAALLANDLELPARIIWAADGREMVLVPAGPFTLGSDSGRRGEEQPAHTVDLPAFYIDRTTVTIGEYMRFVEATGHRPPRLFPPTPRPPDYMQHPVTGVSWHDARAYAEWAGKRLPTEAEWEKAASWDSATQTKRRYPWGDKWEPGRCNMVQSNIDRTTAVGSFSPAGDSPCGAADMAGNVYEWTSSLDWNYPMRPNDGRDALNLYGTRVRRGGAFSSPELYMRTTFRLLSPPDGMFTNDGFRCAVDA